jgi:uncharacterized protein (TIGR00375 family)
VTYVADLHIHSPYARGTSSQLSLGNLARWARLKGIDLLSTGDFTHPRWLREIRDTLRQADGGLLELDGVFFVLGTEVSCVAEQGGRSRRFHTLVLAPSLRTVSQINTALAARGNLGSDGRPTLRVTARDLVEILLDIDQRCLVIPAHLWTPWFGLYGSKSGFDSLEEAFGDMVGHVHAVETGLSSDPAMNWRIPSLDGVSIVSFSDAHSLPNLGRELTVLPGGPSYDGLFESLKAQDIAYTVEFFPEEGKYHYSGHRRCGVRYSPPEIASHGDRCPKCGRRLTLGVMQRAQELAGRAVHTWVDDHGFTRADNGRPPFKTLVALRQIISESLGYGLNTKTVHRRYLELVSQFGNELAVLTEAPESDIATLAGERVAEGVARVRSGRVSIEPGYDGEYGVVKVFSSESGGASGDSALGRNPVVVD